MNGRARILSLLVAACAVPALAEFPIVPLWHPEPSGTAMLEYVYKPAPGPAITWADHAGFTIHLGTARVYDNWSGVDDAPQVRFSLTNPDELDHLQDHDFVATVQVRLRTDRGHKYHAGLCVTLEDGTTMVWGAHGSGVEGDPGTDLRFRRPGGVSQWQSYNRTNVMLKLKRDYQESPRRDVYSAWFSEDGHFWELAGQEVIESANSNEPTHVGVILKNWGSEPHTEIVTFRHFNVTHVYNEPSYYVNNVAYSLNDANAPRFKYNLSGIEILCRVLVRDAGPVGGSPFNQKLYVIHGSGTELDNPLDPPTGPKHHEARVDFDRITNRLRDTGYGFNNENLVVVAPRFKRGAHPYPGRLNFEYQSMKGEEDWILLDIHEDFIRERFPADTPAQDDTFFILGHSGGGQYVTRFSMAHAEKLQAAVASSPASTAFPTYDYTWAEGLTLDSSFEDSNPRFAIDLLSAIGVPMAVVMGECDVLFSKGAEDAPYTMTVGGYSRVDNARKWIRQMVFPTHEVYICPRVGHGYALEKQLLSLIWMFGDAAIDSPENPGDPIGDPADWATIDQWKYTYTADHQDQEQSISPLLVWNNRFRYSKFNRFPLPASTADKRYQLAPTSDYCTVWDGRGAAIGGGTYFLTQGVETMELEIIDGDSWETYSGPKMYYGKLRLYSDSGDYMLEESGAVTPLFIDEFLVGRPLYKYTCTDRYPYGPVAGDIHVGPFPDGRIVLNADSSVTDLETGLPPSTSTLRHWYYHNHRNMLYFMNQACRNDLVFLADPDPDAACLNQLRISDWRWGLDVQGDPFVAGLQTRDKHDIYRQELQTNAIYNPRYFEEWDVAPQDFDGDAYTDIRDNCPVSANNDQADWDGDGLGNACDPEPLSPILFMQATTGQRVGRIDMVWQPVEGATHYRVYRNETDDPDTAAAVTGWQQAQEFSDYGVEPGIDYFYWVSAASDGNGTHATPLVNHVTGWAAMPIPASVAASDGTFATHVHIAWNPGRSVDYYRVYRGPIPDPAGVQPLSSWQTAAHFDDTAATPGVTYWYFVKAAPFADGYRGSDFSDGVTGFRATGGTGACCVAGACQDVADDQACDALAFVCDVTTNELPECGGPCGTTCFGDANGDGVVAPADRGFVSANVGATQPTLVCQYDLDGNGVISPSDRGFVSANVGLCTPLPDYQNGSGLNGGQPDARFAAPLFLGAGTECASSVCP